MKRALIIAGVFAGVCFGQVMQVGPDGHATVSGTVSGSTVSSNTVIAEPQATTWNITGGGGQVLLTSTPWGNEPWETRKLDGKGPTLHEVKMSAALVRSDQLAPKGYYELAKSVGVPFSTDDAKILDVIYKHNLKVYDFDKVDNYLYRKALKQGTHARWVWKPMRDEDLHAVSRYGSASTRSGLMYNELYRQVVPRRILVEMAAIKADLSNVVFLVSDYEVIKPDPFLAISTPDLLATGKLWIVDLWAEPGFTEASEKPAPDTQFWYGVPIACLLSMMAFV